jgi:hypothetical protein
MNAHATAYVQVDSTLADVLVQLDGHDDRVLSILYEGRSVQSGFHVTEVKAGSFVTLDCGGNPDAWTETVLQVEDIPASDGKAQMTAGKFRSILAQVDRRVSLDHDARLTIEIGRPGEAMRPCALSRHGFTVVAGHPPFPAENAPSTTHTTLSDDPGTGHSSPATALWHSP